MRTEVIRLDEEVDRWQWVCPNGHRSWEPTNDHFWCQKCAQLKDVDGVFHRLRNKRTDDLYERDEVRLITSAGPYRELYKGGEHRV
jgi:5-methylcytosine-specific restriction endonuclease McrA